MKGRLIHEPTGLPVHFDGSTYRILGVLKPTKFGMFKNFGDTFDVIPESSWTECSLRKWNVSIWNQGEHGSCVGHGSGAGFTYAWLLSGQPLQQFSPTSVYAHVNNNQDNGAQVSDGLMCLKQYGISLMPLFPESDIYMSQMSTDAQQTALRFRAVDAYKINNWNELGSAIMHGMTVVSGLAVGNNFSQLSSQYIVPLPDYVVGGHCMANIGLHNINGIWYIETQNSWGTTWGDSGFCYLQQNAWNPQYGFPYDAFAINAVYTDPQEIDNEPVLT
jgi:Papain family cysteine protease